MRIVNFHTDRALVLGAGHNGLVCAWALARAGMKVVVLEGRSVVGGAAVTEEFAPGFRNSTASYTLSLLRPDIIRDMGLHRHGLRVKLRPVDNFLPTRGGDHLLAGRDGLTAREIARHSARDAEAYPRYLAMLEPAVALLRRWADRAPPDLGGGVADWGRALAFGRDAGRLGRAGQRSLLDLFTLSAGELLDRFFETDLVKALFGFDAVVGNHASPYTPGSAYVLLHHLFDEVNGVQGAWGHAMGGMGAVTGAMARACAEAGVEIITGAPVSEILVERGSVAGAVANGAAYRAGTVAAAFGPRVLGRLLPEGGLPADDHARLSGFRAGSATFRMNVALSALPRFTSRPDRGEHLTGGVIMAPSLAHMDRAWADTLDGGWSQKPIVEMLIPSTLDDSLAPEGRHVASLFCQHFPYDLAGGWVAKRDAAADHVIDAVDRYAPGFRDLVVARDALTPVDLETRFGLARGDIFHGRMSLDQLFSARPMLGAAAYRMPLSGLYLAGSGAHPGGGVTGAPGRNAARAILADRRPWRRLAA